MILRGNPGLAIYSEQDDVRGRDRFCDLGFDVVGEGGEVFADLVETGALGNIDPESAGIGELDLFGGVVLVEGVVRVLEVDDDRQAVSGYAWGVVNDRDPLLSDEIEEGGLADIGSADDGDAGNGHSRG